MKDYWIEPEQKKINKKKIMIISIVVTIILLILAIIIIYYNNRETREWIDKNIFRKEIKQESVNSIEISNSQNSNIYAFNKYVGILNKNKLNIYSNSVNVEETLDIHISNPIFDSSNRFLAIAEKKGQKAYLINDKSIAWETNVEGNISQIKVNKNGYVAIVIVDTSYKTVIRMYSPTGEKLFNTYMSFTRSVDVDISNDNKYLAIAEVDTSGTMIQSKIKIMSVDKASSDPTNALEKTYIAESNKLIVNIKYQEKNKLACMYTDSISIIENEKEEEIVNNKNKKVTYQTVELNNAVASIEEKSSGLFTADSYINIINISNKSSKEYIVNLVAKEIYAKGDIIALNLGTEIEFVNKEGWLVKRYIAKQEITKISISENIAAIVYTDKIEIINL